jgi:hypothetical protein
VLVSREAQVELHNARCFDFRASHVSNLQSACVLGCRGALKMRALTELVLPLGKTQLAETALGPDITQPKIIATWIHSAKSNAARWSTIVRNGFTYIPPGT